MVNRPADSPGWRGYLAVFAAAVLFRLVCLAGFLASPYFVPVGGDRALYHNLAIAILHGERFAGVFSFLPLYPVLLGLWYKLCGGPNLAAVAIIQALADGLTAVLIVCLACKYYGKMAAFMAGALYVFLGTAAVYSLVTMPVSLGLCWTTLVAAAAIHWQPNWTWRRAALMGLLLGCGGQIIGPFWLMVIPFAVWIALATSRSSFLKVRMPLRGIQLSDGSESRPYHFNSLCLKFIPALLVIAGAALAVVPALAHNYAGAKHIVPLSTHFGLNVYMGNNPFSVGYGVALPGLRTSAEEMTADSVARAEQLSGRALTAAEANRFWLRQASAFWLRQPGAALALLAKKIQRSVSVRDFDDLGLSRLLPADIKLLRLGLVNFGVIWILACLGFMFTAPPPGNRTVFWIMGLCALSGMLITFVTARYRLPLAVLLLPAAGNALVRLPQTILTPALAPSLRQNPLRFLAGLAGIIIAVWPQARPDTSAPDDLNKAIYLSQAGRLKEAAEYAQRACSRPPGSPDAWLALGNVYFAQGNYAAALPCYRRTLALADNRTDALFNAGRALEKMGQKTAARLCYQKIVAREPRHVKAWLGLAWIGRALGDNRAAEEAIKKAEEIVGRQHPQIAEYYRPAP